MLDQSDVGGGLLAAVRRASHDDQLSFHTPPRPVNATGSVIFVETRTATDRLSRAGVVRVCPEIGVAKREAVVQRFLTGRGFPAPAVLLTGSADDELGGAWLLTEQVSGQAVRIGGLRNPVAGLRSLVALWSRPSLLASLSATLHSLDPGPLPSELEAAGVNFDWFGFQWGLAEQLRTPGQTEVVEWLRANRPSDSETVVSHGDLHPGNIVIGTDGPRVVDWAIAGLAPAARDVACTMFALLNTGGQAPAPLRPAFSWLGRSFSRRFLRLYRKRSSAGMTDAELDWHRVLYSVNRIVWSTLEGGHSPVANDEDALAKRASRTVGTLGQEFPLHVELIKNITGIDIAA